MTYRADYPTGRIRWTASVTAREDDETVVVTWMGIRWTNGVPTLAHCEHISVYIGDVHGDEHQAVVALLNAMQVLLKK